MRWHHSQELKDMLPALVLNSRKNVKSFRDTRAHRAGMITVSVGLSRVCAVAQYAVLEANGKVNGIGEISDPSPSQTLGPNWMRLQIYD